VALLDRPSLERDGYRYNVHLILGGQIRGEPHRLYLVYPQGNPLAVSEDSPYLQIGECKYGRPILDRGVRYHRTSLEEAAKYALISIDSTMRSNVTVGPPIDLVIYSADALKITRQRRFGPDDPDLRAIHVQWEQALRKAVQELPAVRFEEIAD
jgi:putative proteasome-type protease